MRARGNAFIRRVYEARVPPGTKRPTAETPTWEVERWIRAKYEEKAFFAEDGGTHTGASGHHAPAGGAVDAICALRGSAPACVAPDALISFDDGDVQPPLQPNPLATGGVAHGYLPLVAARACGQVQSDPSPSPWFSSALDDARSPPTQLFQEARQGATPTAHGQLLGSSDLLSGAVLPPLAQPQPRAAPGSTPCGAQPGAAHMCSHLSSYSRPLAPTSVAMPAPTSHATPLTHGLTGLQSNANVASNCSPFMQQQPAVAQLYSVPASSGNACAPSQTPPLQHMAHGRGLAGGEGPRHSVVAASGPQQAIPPMMPAETVMNTATERIMAAFLSDQSE
mmetsp:Transcript_17018/g.52556  ORF Transcript_17018/g.52556 Transcript_17018/m.52556 type:complete len:337 (-) Transcript_17018:150-1160(-)